MGYFEIFLGVGYLSYFLIGGGFGY